MRTNNCHKKACKVDLRIKKNGPKELQMILAAAVPLVGVLLALTGPLFAADWSTGPNLKDEDSIWQYIYPIPEGDDPPCERVIYDHPISSGEQPLGCTYLHAVYRYDEEGNVDPEGDFIVIFYK